MTPTDGPLTPLEQRMVIFRNRQLVALLCRDREAAAAATRMLDVALDHWARQHAAFPRDPFSESANHILN